MTAGVRDVKEMLRQQTVKKLEAAAERNVDFTIMVTAARKAYEIGNIPAAREQLERGREQLRKADKELVDVLQFLKTHGS